MKQAICIALILGGTLILAGCPKLEQDARDVGAALNGSIVAAQEKYQASCQANSGQPVCQKINQGVQGQNALITSTELYCGWSVANPPTDPKAKCVPVASAEAALTSAIANAKLLTQEIKGAIQ